MIDAILQQLLSWYLQLWPNVVAAPITAALATGLSWVLHRLTTHKLDERRHQEVLAEIRKE